MLVFLPADHGAPIYPHGRLRLFHLSPHNVPTSLSDFPFSRYAPFSPPNSENFDSTTTFSGTTSFLSHLQSRNLSSSLPAHHHVDYHLSNTLASSHLPNPLFSPPTAISASYFSAVRDTRYLRKGMIRAPLVQSGVDSPLYDVRTKSS
jgi:hypothetical protein